MSDNQKTLQCKLVCKSLKCGTSSSNKSQEGGGDTHRPCTVLVHVLPKKEAINLLSHVAATAMGLVKRVNEIINVSAGRKAVNREKLKTSEKCLKRRS